MLFVEFRVNYFKVSAKENIDIHKIFDYMGKQVQAKLEGGGLVDLSTIKVVKINKLQL